jgi:hypothetical protein
MFFSVRLNFPTVVNFAPHHPAVLKFQSFVWQPLGDVHFRLPRRTSGTVFRLTYGSLNHCLYSVVV